MSAPEAARPITLLIAALGGEGGGVLSNWVVGAAEARDLPVQCTSIPGVAQRTGATTYYLEIWPETAATLNGKRPVLSLSAVPGEVDVVLASELLEAGRAAALGLVTPDRTSLVTSTHRVYTTKEKMAEADGRHDAEQVGKAIEARSARLVAFDMRQAAAEARAPLSAVMLGALAGAGVLPVSADDCRAAIEREGKAVAANLAGFEAGLQGGGSEAATHADSDDGATFAAFPTEVRPTLAIAVPRLADYQDTAYAAFYLERLRAFDGLAPEVLKQVARVLATRMAYEDVIRVAQLKLRASRMRRIEQESQADSGDLVYVTDLFKPGIAEIADILPVAWGRRLLARAERDPDLAQWQWPLALRTDRLGGALRLGLLAGLRRWRRWTYRFHHEQQAIENWLRDVAAAQAAEGTLSMDVVDCARLVRGYGETRLRGVENYNRTEPATPMRL